jgi:hypothetical protein
VTDDEFWVLAIKGASLGLAVVVVSWLKSKVPGWKAELRRKTGRDDPLGPSESILLARDDARKATKAEVGWGAGQPQGERCEICAHFDPQRLRRREGSCELVAGVIRAGDRCRLFERE